MPANSANTPARAARLRARLTLDELANRAGVSLATIVRAEKPGAWPALRTQRRLAEVLETDPEALWPYELEAA